MHSSTTTIAAWPSARFSSSTASRSRGGRCRSAKRVRARRVRRWAPGGFSGPGRRWAAATATADGRRRPPAPTAVRTGSRAAAIRGNRNFGPNKPPKGRGGSNFAKNRNQEGKAKGPLKERLSGRMFSVEEDARFRDEDDTGVEEVDLDLEGREVVKEEEVKRRGSQS